MGTILSFRPNGEVRAPSPSATACEIVIFPGVRIERHELDLGLRMRESAGIDEYDGLGSPRPRKSS